MHRWVGASGRTTRSHDMGILDNIGKGRKRGSSTTPRSTDAASPAALKSTKPAKASKAKHPRSPATSQAGAPIPAAKTKPAGKRRRKGSPASPRERVQASAAPLHDRRRRLVGARETTLRDLGGLMLEMYKRNRFREELLLDKCEEVLAIEVEIAHVDQRLFQLAPPNAAGMRPIGRCECGASIHPGQNFCGLCGRSFATLTQARSCARCGSGLRPGDQFCATCGADAPDALQAIEAPSAPGGSPHASSVDAASIAASAVAETVIIEAPPLDDRAAPAAAAASSTGTSLPSVVPAPAVAEPVSATPAPAPAPAPAPVADPAPAAAGFDWTNPPAAPDAAIDAAVESMPHFATVPPTPIINPIDVTVPSVSAPDTPTPAITPNATPTTPATPATPASDKAAARAAKKAETAAQKQQLKDAKARAKARAKAARAQRKRGGDE